VLELLPVSAQLHDLAVIDGEPPVDLGQRGSVGAGGIAGLGELLREPVQSLFESGGGRALTRWPLRGQVGGCGAERVRHPMTENPHLFPRLDVAIVVEVVVADHVPDVGEAVLSPVGHIWRRHR
jgi:hypothetical protein